MNRLPTVHEAGDDKYAVMLPCTKDNFSEFIASLLGKSQTIESTISGTFEVTKDDLVNLHHLVHQRVSQQNDGSPMQFSVTISYDDFSSITLNSFDDFIRYAEVRPHQSHAATLTWIYLIKFHDKGAPEKQEINVTFKTKDQRSEFPYPTHRMRVLSDLPKGQFFVQIQHTARSWGVDIEALLIGHLATLRLKESRVREFIERYSALAGWIGFFAIILITAGGVYYTMLKFSEAKINEFRSLVELGTSQADFLEGLGAVILSGDYARFTVALVFFVVAMLIASIAFGLMISDKADSGRRSFLILTKSSEQAMREARKTEGAFFRYFFGSIVGGIFSGIVGNALFLALLGG